MVTDGNLETFWRWDLSSNLGAVTRTGIFSHIMPNKWRTIIMSWVLYSKFDTGQYTSRWTRERDGWILLAITKLRQALQKEGEKRKKINKKTPVWPSSCVTPAGENKKKWKMTTKDQTLHPRFHFLFSFFHLFFFSTVKRTESAGVLWGMWAMGRLNICVPRTEYLRADMLNLQGTVEILSDLRVCSINVVQTIVCTRYY